MRSELVEKRTSCQFSGDEEIGIFTGPERRSQVVLTQGSGRGFQGVAAVGCLLSLLSLPVFGQTI